MKDDVHVISPENRKPAWLLLGVWMGFIVVAGTMVAGGSLTQSFSFGNIVVLTLVANVLLGGIAAVFGYVGATTGSSFAHLSRLAFPGVSHRLVSLYVPIVLTFWFAVLASILGQYLVGTFHWNDSYTVPISMALCFLLSVTSYFGIQHLGILSAITVPLIVILGSYAVAVSPITGQEAASQIGSISAVNTGLGVIVSTWIMGATLNIPDITRFARSGRAGALIGLAGIVVGNSFNIIIGARAALIGGTADPGPLLLALGLPALGFVFVVANLWTTNDNNMYSASLGLSEAGQVSRRRSVLILASIAAVLVLFNVGNLQTIMSGILLMGATAPALAAVVLSSYLSRKVEAGASSVGFPWQAWVAWFGGAAISLNVEGILGLVVGTISAFAIHRGLSYAMQAIRN
nr:cytosine permease [uncultured Hyphomonas sp.]